VVRGRERKERGRAADELEHRGTVHAAHCLYVGRTLASFHSRTLSPLRFPEQVGRSVRGRI
jgi:hypothetical protein